MEREMSPMRRSTYKLTPHILAGAVLAVLALAAPEPAHAKHAPGNSCAVGLPIKYNGYIRYERYDYRIIRSSLPANTRRREERHIASIRNGMRSWNEGKNDCHYPPYRSFRTAYVGDSGSSYDDHEDGISTVDFGSTFDCSAMAIACASTEPSARNIRGKIISEAVDIRFRKRSGLRWYPGVGFPSSRKCGGLEQCYDLWSASAHEVGHVVGLSDHAVKRGPNDQTTDRYRWQNMFYRLDLASSPFPNRKRTLGRLDYVGMKNLYEGLDLD